MTLEQCTKAELIQIIKKTNYLSDDRVKRALLDIEGQRIQKRFKAAEGYGIIAAENLNKYIEILKPYEGKKLLIFRAILFLKRQNTKRLIRKHIKKGMK